MAAATGPDPHLLGILVVAQTRAGTGAQVLFHYPPDPLAEQDHPTKESDYTAIDGSSSSDSDSESSSDDNVYEITPLKPKDDRQEAITDDDDDDYSNKLSRIRSDERWKPSWEPLLGIGEEGLVSLLAPGRAWHKRKFELSINDLVFVGRPVYARESGAWGKRKRKTKAEDLPKQQNGENEDDLSETEHQEEETEHDADASSAKSSLTMFHVVFILNPPPLEHTQKVKDIYDNIVRKLSKVLKWEQANNDYVWRQTDLIQGIKTSHFSERSPTSTLYNDLLQQSTLAAAIATVYRSISSSRIAAVTLSPDVSISLQIPPITSTSLLPSLTDPPIQPGLWLTTANDTATSLSDLDVDASNPNNSLQLAKSFTLLLRDHPQKILKDVQTTAGPLALPMTEFITSLTPSKSFYKISQSTGSPLGDIQLLSRHLIYWRRAIAIPPLQQRDIYIVSPNADLAQLASATRSFEMAFPPPLPSLPRLLSQLSGPPAPFGTLIPSSDHKEEYYRVLAWLLRGGWVTQLRSFAFIRISPAIKKAVRDSDRQEKHDTTQNNLERLNLNSHHNHHRQPSHTQPKPSTSASSTSTSFNDKHHPQFRNRPHLSRPTSSSTNTTTTTATRATASGPQHIPSHASLIASPLRASALENKWLSYLHASLLPEPTPTTKPPPPPPFSSSPPNKSPSDTAGDDRPTTTTTHQLPSIAPLTPTPTDSWAHLSAPARRDLHAAWPRLVKYFTGQEALEKIAVREGWKRKWTAELLGLMGAEGFSLGGGGGGGVDEREDKGMERGRGNGGGGAGGRFRGQAKEEAVVVTFRHW